MMLNLPSECSCTRCKNTCINSPCFGNPVDIKLLIDGGYSVRLVATAWIDIEWNSTWPVIAPILTPNGCTFLTTDGLCSLHSLGLKPTEGRLAHRTNPDPEKLRRSACFSWVNQTGFNLLEKFGANAELLQRLTTLRQAYNR